MNGRGFASAPAFSTSTATRNVLRRELPAFRPLRMGAPENVPEITFSEMPMSPGDVSKAVKFLWRVGERAGLHNLVKGLFASGEAQRLAPSVSLEGGTVVAGSEDDMNALLQLVKREHPAFNAAKQAIRTAEGEADLVGRILRSSGSRTEFSPLSGVGFYKGSMRRLGSRQTPGYETPPGRMASHAGLFGLEEERLQRAWLDKLVEDEKLLRSALLSGNERLLKETKLDILERRWPQGFTSEVRKVLKLTKTDVINEVNTPPDVSLALESVNRAISDGDIVRAFREFLKIPFEDVTSDQIDEYDRLLVFLGI